MNPELIDQIVKDAELGNNSYSQNEWDPLRKVIVGVADYACVPKLDRSMRCVNYPGNTENEIPPSGQYPEQVIEEANQDLEKLVALLQRSGIEVVRPQKAKAGYNNLCPRDILFAYKKQAFASPVPLLARKDDWGNFAGAFKSGELKILPTSYESELYDTNAIGNPDLLGLTEKYPAFDASNILKADNQLLYLVSNTGNRAGADVLRKLYKRSSKVFLLEDVNSYRHINKTIAFLRDGLLMVNPFKISDHRAQLPAPFNTWDCIYAPEPVDIGHFPGYCHGSAWINLNVLSLDPQTVVLEQNQRETQAALKKHGIKSIMMPMRHSRTLGGSFHSVTLDLKRKHD